MYMSRFTVSPKIIMHYLTDPTKISKFKSLFKMLKIMNTVYLKSSDGLKSDDTI